jgi:transcriptional regulator with XRE-family HTH domain
MGFKENLKSELAYQGMLVKELAALSGVNQFSINSYLNSRGQIPSAEVAVKIADALGVSVEYLVTGKDTRLGNKSYSVARLFEQLTETERKFAIAFIKWLKNREIP